MDLDPNTLYYSASTIPQVVAAVAAVITALAFFRIAALQEFLIGDGKAAVNRWGQTGYDLNGKEGQKQKNRLEDAICRRSVHEIKHVIFLLRNREIEQGFSKQERPTGLQHVYDERFCMCEKLINAVQCRIKCVVGLAAVSAVSIVLSIVSLAMADIIMTSSALVQQLVLWSNMFAFILSLVASGGLVFACLFKKSPYEEGREFETCHTGNSPPDPD